MMSEERKKNWLNFGENVNNFQKEIKYAHVCFLVQITNFFRQTLILMLFYVWKSAKKSFQTMNNNDFVNA